MQKYQEKPLALVLRDQNGKYKVNQQALQLFSGIEGKLAIISVAGMYRTGKSFLLNTMLLNIKNGFAVGPTVNPKTKGIWVWGKPLIFKNDQDQIMNVLVLDSEGLGSTEQDINHDLRLFSITLLLSSAFMYNTVGAIDQNAIDRLGLVLRLCQHLKNGNFNDFPDFYWILRDFSLALVDKNNTPMTTKAYLENCLSDQPNDSEYRNKIRHSIKQAFENRYCYTFVRPLMNQQSLQSLDKMQLEELRPQFVEEVINFRKSIFGNLRIKSIKGRQIKGNMLCELINIYVECINGDKLPVIESGWEQLCLKELHDVLFSIEDAVAKKVRDIKERLPRTRKELLKEQQALMDQFQEIFARRLKNNDRAKQYFKSVEEIITKQLKGIEEDMKIKNSSQTQAFVRKEFESIQKRLKQSEFKNMGQLVKEFQIFYEYYRKKCPYKDEIQTGLELLMKKFSDSSLILFKSTHARKDVEIQQLRDEISKTRAQNSTRQQKLKQEKNHFQDKSVKLETNIEEIRKQNDELSQQVAQLQGKLEIAQNMNNHSMEEELTHENIVLKKKMMDLEDKIRELLCTHSQEINALKQQLLLKTNSAEHSQKQKMELVMKLDQLQLMYKNNKELNEQRIQDLMAQLEDSNGRYSMLQKTLKFQLIEKQQTIEDLERTIEYKNEEITEILQKNSQQNSMLSEMLLQQERRSLQEKQKQVADLHSQLNATKVSLKKRIAELQSQMLAKETQFKIGKLSVEQQKALLVQKIQFIKKQSQQKIQKNAHLQEQLANYVQMIEEKDLYIQELTNQIEELRNSEQMEGEQIQKKITQMGQKLQIKNSQIKSLQAQIEKVTISLNKKIEEKKFKIQQMQILLQKNEEEVKKYEKQINELRKAKQENDMNMEQHIENMKFESQRYLQDQKRNAELSLVQLKNFYEMQKERLQKRLLEERKKYEYNEANTVSQLRSKYTKQVRTLTEENNELNAKLEDLQEEITKIQNQYQIRIMGLEEDRESERKSSENRYEIMKKKYEEAAQDLTKNEKQHEEDRISFLKKIEGLNFQISKKQKQLLQINVKKQSLQASINKKQAQLENIKKTMHQEIESSLKKVSETQGKYQKVNQQYSKFKIEAEKQNALLNQRNQFLNARIGQLTKDKESGSLKNLQKIERNKITELKQQLDRQKSQNMSLEAKIQNLRKSQKQSSIQYKKQINQLQKDNMFSKQKLEIAQSKINELQIKISQKTELFKKEVDEMRLKYSNERLKLQSDLDNQRQKFNQIEDDNKEKIFKLQMELALVTDRITNVELQRDQTRKQLEETQKRLQNAFTQIKKQNEKGLDSSQMKRNSVDKRYSNQIQLMKMSTKARQEQLEEGNKKLKEQIKQTKQKNFELQERLNRAEKLISQDKNLSEEIQKLKREKQQLILVHRNQIQKEIDDWKRKYNELEKKNRQIQKQNNAFVFILEKQKAKHNAEKDEIIRTFKEREDMANWQKMRPVESKTRTEASRSKKFSMTASDVLGNLSSWQ